MAAGANQPFLVNLFRLDEDGLLGNNKLSNTPVGFGVV